MSGGFQRWMRGDAEPLYDQVPMAEHIDDDKSRMTVGFDADDGPDSPDSPDSPGRPDSSSSITLDADSDSNSTRFFGHDEAKATSAGRRGGGVAGLVMAALAVPLLVARLGYEGALQWTEMARQRRWRQEEEEEEGGGREGRAHVLVRMGRGFVVALVPSFLRPTTASETRRLHATAWLDGLRGVAAFFVVWHHASLLWFSWKVHDGFGSRAEAARWLIQLPVVRLLVSGPPQVAVFFVVSGYALSYKPVRLARQGRGTDAVAAVASAVFRRHTRLFLMPAVLTLVIAVLTQLNAYKVQGLAGVAVPGREPPHADGLGDQLRHALRTVGGLLNPLSLDWRRGVNYVYDANYWTLAIEFDCSMLLFLCQAAFCRFRARVRMLLTAGLVVLALYYYLWQAFLFLAGMLLCDLRFACDGVAADTPAAATAPGDVDPESALAIGRPAFWRAHRRTLLGSAAFVAVIYLLSMPEERCGAATTPGYATLYRWVPAHHREHGQVDHWYVPLAAALLVLVVDHTPALQVLFTNAFAQYLGRISYSMYLIHGSVLWTLGAFVVHRVSDVAGTATQLRYGLAVAASALCCAVVIVVLSDCATRVLDARAVKLGRVLDDYFAMPPPARPSALPLALPAIMAVPVADARTAASPQVAQVAQFVPTPTTAPWSSASLPR